MHSDLPLFSLKKFKISLKNPLPSLPCGIHNECSLSEIPLETFDSCPTIFLRTQVKQTEVNKNISYHKKACSFGHSVFELYLKWLSSSFPVMSRFPMNIWRACWVAWDKLVIKCFLLVYREYPSRNMICLRLHTHLKARVYTTRNHSWDISRYTTRKHCITSINKNCERFEPRIHFKRKLSFIVRVNVVLNRTVVVDSDWRFDNLYGILLAMKTRNQ